jgi:hypothetical protein
MPVMPNTIIAPIDADLSSFYSSELSSPFSLESLSFVRDLSQRLLSKQGAVDAELHALGFWCRSQKIEQIRDAYFRQNKHLICRPKGTVFQIAPGNVDSLFMYSGLLSLLLGNRTLVRLSNKKDQRFARIFSILNEVLSRPEHVNVAKRFHVMRCDYDSHWLLDASVKCDLRIIWGGDEAVRAIRQIPLAPKAKELSFADRVSLCLFNAVEICRCDDMTDLFQRLARDVFTHSQHACSSPKVLIWHGSKKEVQEAQEKFWPSFQKWIALNHLNELSDADVLARIAAVQSMSVLSALRVENDEKHSLVRLRAEAIDYDGLDFHRGYGVLVEIALETLNDLTKGLHQKVQTLSYWGYERTELFEAIDINTLETVDRVVKVGGALEFDHVWDGYDLLTEFSRFLK